MKTIIKNNEKKPYCKVCHDAGKSESVYTSHWVKSLPDKNGKCNIICPTLLDTECRYCYKFGHTTKFCPVLEKHNREKEKSARRNQIINKAQNTKQNIEVKSSIYSTLELSSDSEDEEQEQEQEVSEQFPSLQCNEVQSIVKSNTNELTGWAAIAAKPKEEPVVIKQLSIIIPEKPKLVRQTAIQYDSKPVLAPWAKKDTIIKKSWADYSDSETEDEECEWKTYDDNYEDETW